MYSVRILSSWAVQAPLFKPSFAQQGLLPIDAVLNYSVLDSNLLECLDVDRIK
jgi:hypothetical protein